MKPYNNSFDKLDTAIINWMANNGIFLLRVSVGIVFFWFGILKFFPGVSPAQQLAAKTINNLTFGFIPPEISINLLALWEVLIGIGLLTGAFMRATLFLLFLQMIGTLTPIFIFPNEVFTQLPYAPTLEGQYIIKNLVIISAGIVLGSKVSEKLFYK